MPLNVSKRSFFSTFFVVQLFAVGNNSLLKRIGISSDLISQGHAADAICLFQRLQSG